MAQSVSRYGVSAAMVGVVARALTDLGVPQPSSLVDPQSTYVEGPIADAMLDDAAATLSDPAVGLAIAERISPGSLGLLDYALFTGERWGEAIRRVARFYAVASERVTMTIEESADSAAIVLGRHPLHRQNRHWVEFSLAIITQRARQALGERFTLRRVELAHEAPQSESRHVTFFGAPVEFGQAEDRLVFPRSWLDVPLKTGAALLAEALSQRLAELVPAVHDPTMLRVRAAIAQGIETGDLTLEVVAGRLAMSSRSLQRTLRERRTGFKEQVDTIRRDRALSMLRANELSVAEIGRRVGFAEPAAFFRAFRRWTGTTPGTQRAASDEDVKR